MTFKSIEVSYNKEVMPRFSRLHVAWCIYLTDIQYHTQGFPFVCLCVPLTGPPPLDSEIEWTRELWSNTNLLKWQNFKLFFSLFLYQFFYLLFSLLLFFDIFYFFNFFLLDYL